MNKIVNAMAVVIALCLYSSHVGCSSANSNSLSKEKAMLKVEVLECSGGSQYHGYKVRILETIQNNSGFTFPNITNLQRFCGRSFLTNGEYIVTVYRFGPPKENLWRITDVFIAAPKDLYPDYLPVNVRGKPIEDIF